MATTRFGLDALVREVANGNTASLHPTADKQKMIEICKKLVSIADGFNDRNSKGHPIKGNVGFTHNKSGVKKPFPMSFLVYCGVNTSAHKEEVFRNGYVAFNEECCKSVLKMAKFFGEYCNNHNLSRNDKIVHLATKYYKEVSKNINDWKKDVEKYISPNDFIKMPKVNMRGLAETMHIVEPTLTTTEVVVEPTPTPTTTPIPSEAIPSDVIIVTEPIPSEVLEGTFA